MFTGIKTCIPLHKLFEYANIDPWQAAGACCDSPTCKINFGSCSAAPGDYLRYAAKLLATAEIELKFTCREFKTKTVPYPGRRPCGMRDKKGNWKTVNVRDKNYRRAARRGITKYPTTAVRYTDTNSDCLRETATVTFTVTDPDCNLCEYLVWFDGYDPYLDKYEKYAVRPFKAAYTKASNEVTLTFHSYQLIKPFVLTKSNYKKLPPCEFMNICSCTYDANNEITNDCPLVSSVQPVRLFEDTSDCSVKLLWEGGKDSCSGTCQTTCEYGCVEEAYNGLLRVKPAIRKLNNVALTPDCADCMTTESYTCEPKDSSCGCMREPTAVTVHYVTGCEPLGQTLTAQNGDMSGFECQQYCSEETAVLDRVLSVLRPPCIEVVTESESPVMSHQVSILHAVEKLDPVTGIVARKYEYVNDPSNPLVSKLKDIPATFVLESEYFEDNKSVERGKLTLVKDYGCVTAANRVTISGYGKWFRIEKITPGSDGSLILDLVRKT